MSEISHGHYEMSHAATAEARDHVASLVNQFPRDVPLKAALPAIARRVGMTARRVTAIWHREARAIHSAEMDALRAAVSKEARNELLRTAGQLEAMAHRLAVVDPEMAGPQIDAMRDAARRARNLADGDIK